MQFSSIPGIVDLKKNLVQAYQRNHIAHAQLFSGEEGGAALPMALAFATYLLCENKTDEDSCGECDNCRKMQKYIHPDVHFFYPSPRTEKEAEQNIQARIWREFLIDSPFGVLEEWIERLSSENKQNQISKNDARQIIKTVSMKSFEGGFKILFIWYPELMHPSAANAILKVLEEPPENTLYFLVTFNYEGLMSTILSRTQLVVVPSFKDETVRDYLIAEKGLSSAQAEKVSKIAKGNIREAERHIDSEENIAFQDFQKWMRACYQSDFTSLTQLSEQFSQRSKSDQRAYLSFGIDLIRNSVLAKGASDLSNSKGEENKFVTDFSRVNGIGSLEKIYSELNSSLVNLSRNANAKITHLALSLRLIGILRKSKAA